MSKQMLMGSEARAALLTGLDKVANAVKITLGPRGRNVLIDRPLQPLATRDGVTVAKATSELPNPFEQMGALYAREVADAAVVEAGDGTTTATVILQAIVREGLKLVTEGAEPLLLADGIEAAAKACAATIELMAVPATPELVKQAAIISTHGDVELGSMIAEATCKVGATGVLELQESRDETTTIEHVEGYYFERGWRPNMFFVREARGQRCVLEKPLILISERTIVGAGLQGLPNGNVRVIQGDGIGAIVEQCVKARRALLIIAEDLVGDAMSVFATNVCGGQLPGGCFVKLPGFGDQRQASIEDLRVSVGAKRVHTQTSTQLKDQLSSFTVEDLGACERAVISMDKTVLIKGSGDQIEIGRRVAELSQQSTEEVNPYAKQMIDTRIARLFGGVAVLRVGAESEPAMIEKKARAEDAIHACRGALQQGLVPGGGVALVRASQWGKHTVMMEMQDDVSKGCRLLLNAIQEPVRQILRNAAHPAPEKIIDQIITAGKSYGYNAALGRFGDLYEMGIVDPCKVVLTALRKAASVGALLLTSEVLVTDLPAEKPQSVPPGAYRS